MAYAWKENIPVVCRGAGTGLAGGATCKFGGIMLSVMRMNQLFPSTIKPDHPAEPGALLIVFRRRQRRRGVLPAGSRRKDGVHWRKRHYQAGGMKAVRYGLTRDFVRSIEAECPTAPYEFSPTWCRIRRDTDHKDLVIGSEGTLCILTQVTLKLLPAPTCSCTLVLPFKSLEECADMVPKVLELPLCLRPSIFGAGANRYRERKSE